MLFYSKYITRKKFPKKDGEKYALDRVDSVPINDGCGHRTLIVHQYLEEAKTYLEEKLKRCALDPNVENLSYEQVDVAKKLLREIIIPLVRMSEDERRKDDLGKKFIDFSQTKPIIVVATPISPISVFFAYSRILYRGKFTCELDIYNANTMQAAFQECKLVNNFNQEEADKVISEYWKKELFYLPISRGIMSKYLHVSADVLENLIIRGRDVGYSTPYILLNQIEQFYNEEFEAMMTERYNNLLNVLIALNIPNFPDEDSLRDRNRINPIIWNPLIQTPAASQSQESMIEQNKIIKNCKNIIEQLFNKDKYIHPSSILLVGAPGVGKTHVNSILMTYALTLNLTVCVSALTAQRARELGGVHLHELFCLQPFEHTNVVTDLQSEKSVLRLILDNPLKLEYLRRLDVLFIDEIGLLSREMFAIIDNVLKTIRKSSVVFGGLLFVCTGDHCQLNPVSGSDVWSSFYTFVSFKVFLMKEMVRSHNDKELQKIIRALRKAEIPLQEQEEVSEIFDQHLETNLVANFEDVPNHQIKLLSKKAGVKHALRCINEARKTKIEQENESRHPPQLRIPVATFECVDRMQSNLGYWIPASAEVSKGLSYEVREPEVLTITEEQLLRFTRNTDRYCQGQVCKVQQIIFKENEPDTPHYIKVLIAKPGTCDFDDSCLTIRVEPVWTRNINIRKPWVTAQRKQLPLDNAEVTTIHKGLGRTCDVVSTQVSYANAMFAIWERPMFLVIISRVRNLKDITFVGDKEDTMKAIKAILAMKCENWSRIERMLEAKDKQNEMIPYETFSLHGEDFFLPGEHSAGYIYFLVSLKHKHQRFIGYTSDLRQELNDINMGKKDIGKSPAMRPWVVMGFVAGVLTSRIEENKKRYHYTDEGGLLVNLEGISEHRQSTQFMDRVEECVTEWNTDENKPYRIRLIWSCSKHWFEDNHGS